MAVEKVWMTKVGYKAVVVMQSWKIRCGYVGIGKEHPLYEVIYHQHSPALMRSMEKAKEGVIGKREMIPIFCWNGISVSMDVVFDVHGGVTYSEGSGEYPIESKDIWWIGFDCSHAGDACAPDSEREKNYPSRGIFRSLEYCVEECESLAAQLKKVEKNNEI